MKTKELIYYLKVLKRDLINKSLYKTNRLPHLKKTILSFHIKEYNLKNVVKAALALQMLTGRPAKLVVNKASSTDKVQNNESFKVTVTIHSSESYDFLFAFLNEVYVQLEKDEKRVATNILSSKIKLENVLRFEELEYNRLFFSGLPSLTLYLDYGKPLTPVERKLLSHIF